MLDSYYLLNQKIKKHIIMFPIIVIIIFTILLLLLYKVKIPIYLEGTTVEYDTNILLKIYIPLNKLNFIEKQNQILLNEKEYNYQIKEIEKNNKQEAKVTVHLSPKLDDEIIRNKIDIKYKIEIDKMSLPNYLFKKIKERRVL